MTEIDLFRGRRMIVLIVCGEMKGTEERREWVTVYHQGVVLLAPELAWGGGGSCMQILQP